MRKAGILMPIASLPSECGIGDFGETSYQFIDYLHLANVKIWQILPLNPLGYGNSPYQAYSSCAMDELYISLKLLKEEGLINDYQKFNENSDHIDYNAVRAFKLPYLKEAYNNFKEDDGYCQFVKMPWVKNYAIFLTLKKVNNMQCWLDWPSEMKYWVYDHQMDLTPYNDAIRYEMFIQYILYTQWFKVKKYANDHGIEIMGDIPFYVGIDSDDVYFNQANFLIEDDGHPTFVAGVPPDYFSETGQRWGNPIYDWHYLKNQGFSFWLDRLGYCKGLFDIIRIDHFRAFDTYWMIPSSCDTAIEGEWVNAPGYELFDKVFATYPDINIIAEDLGELRPEVLMLRDHYGFKGMRIIEFSFNANKMGKDRENLVIYTGTHDNMPIRAWYMSLNQEERIKIKKYFKKHRFENKNVTYNFIEYALASNADIAIIPMCDILNLKNEARLNTPGTVGDPNWIWRLKDYRGVYKTSNYLRKWIKKYRR